MEFVSDGRIGAFIVMNARILPSDTNSITSVCRESVVQPVLQHYELVQRLISAGVVMDS